MSVSREHGYEFDSKKRELWASFYREKTEDRLHILFYESWPFLFFLVGVWSYSFLTPFGQRILAALDMSAHAQTARTIVWGQGKEEWVLTLAIVFQLVLLAIFVACVIHLLYAKKSNTWAGKTATYLLGFLTKALAGFVPSV